MQICSSTQHLNHAIDLVADSFATAVRVIWAGDRAAEYLTAPDVRRHVWHACLSSEYANFSVERERPDFLYSRLTSMKAKDLIAQAYGVRPRGIRGVLGRLGPKARPPEVYRALIAALQNAGPGAELLMRVGEPFDSLIETIAVLPDRIGKHTLAALVHPGIQPEDLALFVWTVSCLERAGAASVRLLLNAREPIKALLAILLEREFPAAPWEGTEMLQPIASADELFDQATRFKNCLRRTQYGISEALKVQNGTKYFYEWKGEEPALIDLVRLAKVGWYVNDVQGPSNVEIPQTSRAEIARAFHATSDICATRLTLRANVYPCGEFWGEVMRRAE